MFNQRKIVKYNNLATELKSKILSKLNLPEEKIRVEIELPEKRIITPIKKAYCLICGDLIINYFKKSTKDGTKYSEISIMELLGTFIPITSYEQEQLHENSLICRFCFTKLNNLDKYMISAEEIKSNLLQIYNRTHNIYPVKIEEEEEVEVEDKVIIEEPHPDFVIQEQFIKEEYEMVEEPTDQETYFVYEDVPDIKCEPEEELNSESEDTSKYREVDIPNRNQEINHESIELILIDGKLNYKCKICEKILKKKENTKKHILMHKNEKKFQCEICSSSFNFLGNLMQHLAKHDNTLKWICDLCGKSFNEKKIIRQHIEDIHIRNYKCNVCELTFSRPAALSNHMRKHVDEKTKKIACEQCNYRCHTRARLAEHMNVHWRVKKHQCTVCKKRFEWENTLREHVFRDHKKTTFLSAVKRK